MTAHPLLVYTLYMSEIASEELPKKVTIIGIPYQIRWEDRPMVAGEENDDVLGLCSIPKRTITISLRQTLDSAASTLVHEIWHAIFRHTGDGDRTLTEEDGAILSELLAYSLYIENPELTEFIKAGIQSAKTATS